ncbi:hypothetical protein KJ870_04860 [bacterium]|jgi:hypothetical protein|nr:hypothetical protein [bacterium]MBU1434252.1 hypothetical protein [bacterium]MBU1503643.1 hypothetical protein [bacterium]
MNVSSYLFQSPYSSPVQVGRLDPSTKQEDVKQEDTKSQQSTVSAPQADLKQQEAQVFAASQVKEVTPAVKSEKLLDMYA